MSRESELGPLQAFSRELNIACGKVMIDNPSQAAEVAKRMGGGGGLLARGTIYAALQGKKSRPRWDTVKNIIHLIRHEARRLGLDPDEVATEEEWRAKFVALKEALKDERTAAHPPETRHEWWRKFADLVPPWQERYLNHEPIARRIMGYEPSCVPELLQTRDYAQEILRHRYADEPQEKIQRRVEFLMLRQDMIEPCESGTRLWMIINESALRNGAVKDSVVRDQIKHLLNLNRFIALMVIPASRGDDDITMGPVSLLRFNAADFPDLVCLKQADGATYSEEEEFLEHYYAVLTATAARAALVPSASKRLLQEIESQLSSRLQR
ncbi:DUF5753 domain-containing protein [Spirillospora sp. CA-294931]|uniref:DUF5753 domain-containing protein n=1 Tax=Spirillospora sp. CA-294931 TaxID=3240042 RepID=UPI003D9041A7